MKITVYESEIDIQHMETTERNRRVNELNSLRELHTELEPEYFLGLHLLKQKSIIKYQLELRNILNKNERTQYSN